MQPTNNPENNAETIYPKDKDWVNITVNRHDGWADDVALVYPEDNWKPDEGELTKINLDEDNEDDEDNTNNEINNNNSVKRSLSKFSVFMIFWTLLLAFTISMMLISYHDRLVRYQNAYEQTKPEAYIEKIVALFRDNDIDAIYGQITALPALDTFESDISIKTYISKDIANKEYSYYFESSSDDENTYALTLNGNKVATVKLMRSTSKVDEFGFSEWYVTYFDYVFTPEYTVDITIPVNNTFSINGINVTEDYLISSTIDSKHYLIDGLFAEPSLQAYDSNENEVPVFLDEETGIYIVK